MLTRMAMVFSDAMFCTSEHSFIATSKKTTIMPAGIDTSMFKRDSAVQKIKNSVVYVGRIAPIKNIDVLIDAVAELDKMGHEFTLHLIGDVLPLDASYLNLLKEKAASLIANNKVAFLGSIPNRNLSVAYDRYEIVVNMTDSGSFDKTILEGMACEGLTVVSNRSFVGVLPEDTLFEERNSHDLARVLVHVLDISGDERVRRGKELREVVEQHHSLALLAQELISSFTQSKR